MSAQTLSAWEAVFDHPGQPEVIALVWADTLRELDCAGFKAGPATERRYFQEGAAYQYRWDHYAVVRAVDNRALSTRLFLRLTSSPSGNMHLQFGFQRLEDEPIECGTLYEGAFAGPVFHANSDEFESWPQPDLAQVYAKDGWLDKQKWAQSGNCIAERLLAVMEP